MGVLRKTFALMTFDANVDLELCFLDLYVKK